MHFFSFGFYLLSWILNGVGKNEKVSGTPVKIRSNNSSPKDRSCLGGRKTKRPYQEKAQW